MRSNMLRVLWKSLPILALLLGSHEANAQPASVGPTNAIICTSAFQSAFTGTASNFTIVASAAAQPGNVGKGIYICGWSASTNNTNVSSGVSSQTTFQLFFTSTGPCNGGGTQTSTFITASHGVTATAPVVDHIDYAFLQAPPTGTAPPNQLCLATGGTGNDLRIIVYFTQF